MAILLIAGVTFCSRLLGSFLMQRLDASPFLGRFLDGTSASVIAALVASVVAQGGLREATAVVLAALIMLRSGSAVWAMIAGMVAAAIWKLTL